MESFNVGHCLANGGHSMDIDFCCGTVPVRLR